MPNWTTNEIKTTKEVADAIWDSENQEVDFNKIIPMPKSLDMVAGGTTEDAIVCYLTEGLTIPINKLPQETQDILNIVVHNQFHDMNQEGCTWAEEVFNRLKKRELNHETGYLRVDKESLYKDGKQYLKNLDEYGALHWYDWCCDNWGTKWNANDSYRKDDGDSVTLVFDTAWCQPTPIFEAIVARFPSATFEVNAFYEEGILVSSIGDNGKFVELESVEVNYEDEFDIEIDDGHDSLEQMTRNRITIEGDDVHKKNTDKNHEDRT